METQIKSFYKGPQGIKFVTIFGYATKGVPALEINGVGKLSKNIKEKLIFITRTRKLPIPLRRFVICVDINELNDQNLTSLKWLEFPLLLMFWYLAGMVPISRLDDCICAGWLKADGSIFQMDLPINFGNQVRREYSKSSVEEIKLIHLPQKFDNPFWLIDTTLLLEHIPKLDFYIDNSSLMPKNSLMT